MVINKTDEQFGQLSDRIWNMKTFRFRTFSRQKFFGNAESAETAESVEMTENA